MFRSCGVRDIQGSRFSLALSSKETCSQKPISMDTTGNKGVKKDGRCLGKGLDGACS